MKPYNNKRIILNLLIISSLGFFQKSLAGVDTSPHPNQKNLLLNSDSNLAKNKRLIFDFWRTVLIGRRLDRVEEFLSKNYIQHNPNVETGLDGFLDFFKKISKGPRPIPDEIPGLINIQAEGDIVTLSFVSELKDSKGQIYRTTWFDMFRIENNKIAEHWDCDTK